MKKKFIVRYIDMKGFPHVEEVDAEDEKSAKSKLKFEPREIIWCEELKIF